MYKANITLLFNVRGRGLNIQKVSIESRKSKVHNNN